MEKVSKFHIIDIFKITGRGLVARGDRLEGTVKVGNFLPFNTGFKDVLLEIDAKIFMNGNISEANDILPFYVRILVFYRR